MRMLASDKRGYLYQGNDPIFAIPCEDHSHSVHRILCIVSESHVFPQYACHHTLSGARISVFVHGCDVFLRVGSDKHLKLFFDLVTPYPALSCGINELCIVSKKWSKL